MKRHLLLTFIVSITTVSYVFAQFTNPFEADPKRYNSQDLLILWADPEETNKLNQRILGFDWTKHASNLTANAFFEQTPKIKDPGSNLSDPARIATASTDLNGDGFDDILMVYRDGANLRYALANKTVNVETGTIYRDISLANPTQWTSIAVGNPTGNQRGLVQVIAGDFDGDGQGEFAIVVANTLLNKIHIIIYDGMGTNELRLRGTIADEDIVPVYFNSAEAFSVTAADLNGNGKDEIILTAVQQNTSGTGQFATFVKVYEVSSNNSATITARGRLVIEDKAIQQVTNQSNTNVTYTQNAVTAIKGANGGPATLVAGVAIHAASGDTDVHNFYYYHISASADLQILTIVDSFSRYNHFMTSDNQGPGLPLLARSGDINGDGRQEAIFFTSSDLFVVGVNEDNTIALRTSIGLGNTNEVQESSNNFVVGDITKDGRDNVVVMHKYISGNNNTFEIRAFKNSGTGYALSMFNSYSFHEQSGMSYRSFAMDLGNYDGDDFFLGEGTLYQCDYYMPVMIIGAPPVHWDKINGVVYDINRCFDGGDCNFGATFTQTTSQQFITSVELTSDWAVSGSVGGGVSFFGVSVGASLEARYGESFSNLQERAIELSQTLTSEAVIDDKIHFFRVPVDVWEYPVKNAAGEIVDYVLGVFPKRENNTVLNISTTKALGNFRPHHEPGNILSYPNINSIQEYPDFPSNAGANAAIFNGLANITYSVSGSNSITLSYSETFGTTNTSSWEAGVSPGFSASGWGLGVEVNGEYNMGAINISSKTVNSTTAFEFQIGNIIGPDGEYNYAAQPLIYWSTDGTGIVTYRVTPLEGGLGTFWEDQYKSKPDPALNLPWRNDVHHSGLDPNDSKVNRTKSMYFSQQAPLPDDTVTVFLTVMNYSLMPITQPVEVQFYIGDPDNGGTVLQGLNGVTMVTTTGTIGARGRQVVQMDFVNTLAMYQNPDLRIFARLDPDNKINEIHEGNNTGWSPLGLGCGQEVISTVTREHRLRQIDHLQVESFPNPARSELTIRVFLDRPETISVRIYDISGRMVQQVVDTRVPYPGEAQVKTNVEALPAGLYVVEVVAGNQRSASRFMKQ